MQRDHEGKPAEGIDIHQRVLGTRYGAPDLIDPAGIWPCQQNPANGSQIRRHHEGSQHHGPGEALARHISARHRPCHGYCDDNGYRRGQKPEQERIPQGIQIALPAIGCRVIHQGEVAGFLFLKADQQHFEEWRRDQENQGCNQQKP